MEELLGEEMKCISEKMRIKIDLANNYKFQSYALKSLLHWDKIPANQFGLRKQIQGEKYRMRSLGNGSIFFPQRKFKYLV